MSANGATQTVRKREVMTIFNSGKLSLAGFAFPAMPLAAFLQAMYFFLTPLYAVEMGLGTAAVGGIFFTAKMFDVVTDPLFGAFSDRFKTPWGRRRPWLVIGVVIMMLSIYMLFMPSGTVTASYFLGWLVIMYIGWTMTTVSHTAWALQLSTDYDQRTRITGWLQVSVMIGLMLVALTPAILEHTGAPTHAEKTTAVAWLLLILLPISVFICLKSLDEPLAPPQPRIGLRRALAVLAGNWTLLRETNGSEGWFEIRGPALAAVFVERSRRGERRGAGASSEEVRSS
jgi:Na+/melibiose symporter-like transporter